jgi:hypothetical protein
MSTSLELIDDAVDQLAPFIALTKNSSVVTELDAPFHLKELVQGIILSSKLLAQASLQAAQAKNSRKRKEAVAFLEKYPEHLKANSLKKGTVAEIEAFVTLDKDVCDAQDKEAYFESLVVYISNVRQSLIMSHDDIKKSVYNRSIEGMNRTAMIA